MDRAPHFSHPRSQPAPLLLSVVVPLYNEQENVAALWERLRAVLGPLGAPCEVLWVDDGSGPCPDWATPYRDASESGARAAAPWPRTGDDLWLIYTGGTTGAPKGVMWRQDDLLRVLNGRAAVPMPVDSGTVDDVARLLTAPGPVALIASPLMHAAAQVRARRKPYPHPWRQRE